MQDLAKLRHPNLSTVEALALEEDSPHMSLVIVEEFVEGVTLKTVRERLRANPGALNMIKDKSLVFEMIVQILQCLQALNSKNEAHRDICMQNILIARKPNQPFPAI